MGKYDHIDFKPPKSVAEEAARGLELRRKNKGKGGLNRQQAKSEGVGSGVQRAINLKNRNKLSPSTVRRMKSFFDRHKKNKKIEKGKKSWEDLGYISWSLWGGDPGYSWAKKIVRQMDAADKKAKALLICNIIKLANVLDKKLLFDEADKVDVLLKDFISKYAKDPLDKYKEKRKFDKTPEPKSGGKGQNTFVIQKHLAKKAGIHFDLRLQKNNVLESWSIPKAKLPDKKEKLLAVQTEPHPLSYAKFEGNIPTGQYGAGEVKIYDSGTYELIKWSSDTIKFKLNGKKEKGKYTLHKTNGKQWIIMQGGEK